MDEKEPYMCDLCGLHEVDDEGGWCDDCIEEAEQSRGEED